MWEKDVYSIRLKLIHCIKEVPEEKLNIQTSEGKWTIAQHVLHLAGAEKRFLTLALNTVEAPIQSVSEPVNLSILDDTSEKMKAPIEPSSEPQTVVSLLVELNNSRQLTNSFLEKYSESDLQGKYMEHHRFGVMPIWQVLELLGKHEQRHLHQIQQIKEEILS